MRQDLGVAPATEAVPARDELAANRVVVVQLAVLDRPDAFELVRERLMAAVDVDDAEAANAERDARSRVEPPVVRPAVCHHVRHAHDDVAVDERPLRAPDLGDAADTAHVP